MNTALPPRPVADQDTQPFWDAVSEHRLVVQRCASCTRWIWQPRPLCPYCHATDPVWTNVSGDGRVASWTALYPPVLGVWKDQLPFVVLLIELNEGVRMLGQLVDDGGALLRSDGHEVTMGAGVHLRWRVDEAGQTLPAWTLG